MKEETRGKIKKKENQISVQSKWTVWKERIWKQWA